MMSRTLACMATLLFSMAGCDSQQPSDSFSPVIDQVIILDAPPRITRLDPIIFLSECSRPRVSELGAIEKEMAFRVRSPCKYDPAKLNELVDKYEKALMDAGWSLLETSEGTGMKPVELGPSENHFDSKLPGVEFHTSVTYSGYRLAVTNEKDELLVYDFIRSHESSQPDTAYLNMEVIYVGPQLFGFASELLRQPREPHELTFTSQTEMILYFAMFPTSRSLSWTGSPEMGDRWSYVDSKDWKLGASQLDGEFEKVDREFQKRWHAPVILIPECSYAVLSYFFGVNEEDLFAVSASCDMSPERWEDVMNMLTKELKAAGWEMVRRNHGSSPYIEDLPEELLQTRSEGHLIPDSEMILVTGRRFIVTNKKGDIIVYDMITSGLLADEKPDHLDLHATFVAASLAECALQILRVSAGVLAPDDCDELRGHIEPDSLTTPLWVQQMQINAAPGTMQP